MNELKVYDELQQIQIMNNFNISNKLSKTKSNFGSLKELMACKEKKILSNSISKLKELKTFYDNKFLSERSIKKKVHAVNAEQQEIKPDKSNLFQSNFETISKKLCEDTIFELNVFLAVHGEGHRNKIVLSKLYGYTEELENMLFPNKRSQLKIEINIDDLYQGLGLQFRGFKTRNDYNKLRLFFVQLRELNKKQQEIEGKLIKLRMNNKLQLIDHEMGEMLKSKQKRGDISKYVKEIQRTHETMINNKLKIHNRRDNVRQFQSNFGKIQLNNYYLKQQKAINDIQQYFTSNRLKRLN